ncbi:LysR substrate-binding domain-containing protein [Undibacterium sp. TJN25]|uniref:LysR substrate-binding domain-containing protein n=1 Tax=Undibacterium sp. TJN25 TaxID=3413056 RepID=UPI003BF41BC3
MDRLKAMQTFVRIVDANSFSKAAETLDLPRASLTTTMQNLEALLGAQLLQRTTRRLSLTPEGAEYYQKCVEILGAVDEAEASFRSPDAGKFKGKLRIDLPGAVGRNVVLPHISTFRAAYPNVELIISLTDRYIDLTQEGVDCALRVGSLQDSSLIGRQIGNMRFVTCASPAYLQQHGTPLTIDDLRQHQRIVHFSGRTGRAFDWDFVVDGKVVKVEIGGSVSVNDADGNICCGLQGLGLVHAAAYQVRGHLHNGSLVEVLQQWPPSPMPVSLLYPRSKTISPKLKMFTDWISNLISKNADLQA